MALTMEIMPNALQSVKGENKGFHLFSPAILLSCFFPVVKFFLSKSVEGECVMVYLSYYVNIHI